MRIFIVFLIKRIYIAYFWFNLHLLLRLLCPRSLQAPHRFFISSNDSGRPFLVTTRLSCTCLLLFFGAPFEDTLIGSPTTGRMLSVFSVFFLAKLLCLAEVASYS